MPEEARQFTVRSLEPDVRALWRSRRLPPPGGLLGPKDGAIVRQFEGSIAPGDPPEMIAHRAVAADVDARHLMLSGRGVSGTLRYEVRREETEPNPIGPLLETLGVWTGGAADRPWDSADRMTGIQAIVSRLARREILAARDGPLRLCLSCRVPRTPERIIYQKEVGDTFLVRFPLQGTDPPVDALVWVDAPWRLLGASALLVHPEVPYAVVEYRHKGSSALLLVSRGALDRLRAWLPDVELEVREERPGREWVGRPYAYPLRHEFPIGGGLDPPAGTVQADLEVGDTGTGIVPLVPGHGPTDAEIADRLGITGWPLLTPSGLLDPTLMHKYSGLDVETANEFVSRDLTESGAVLARLRVVRGVPYCAICGHRMVWVPGRAWCLEPTRLPAEQKDRYAHLLPRDRPIGQIEIARWPVSETSASRDPSAISLLECARCERLDAPDGPIECPCGGTRRLVARRLLPSIGGAFGAWSRCDPLPRADTVRIYTNERRRVPALVHHLSAMTGIDASISEIGLTLVPTVARIDLAELVAAHGADAVRAAFVRTAGAGGSTTTFEERCRQEEERCARFFSQAEALLEHCTPEILREGARPPDAAARDLEVEDRAILARWARTHLRVLASYDRWQPDTAHRQLFRFLERDLLEYLEITRPRLDFAGSPATKRGALRTLVYLFRAAAIALAPIAPFTADTVHRRLLGEPRSLFESTDLGGDRTLVNEELATAWDRWHAVIASADTFRRDHHLASSTQLPLAAIVFRDEETAARLRADRATIERLARIARLEVTSPQVPWAARQRRLVPVESEIQRAYPALATQIVHLLERMPPRRSTESPGRELTVFVHGVPRTITPEMVTTVDTLPEGYAPIPYGPGEMYVQPPPKGESIATPPPLSSDAFWVVRWVRRRLAAAPAAGDPAGHVAIVSAVDPLAAELREKSAAIAEYLGLRELRIVGNVPESLPHAQMEGRTRTGARWTVSLPGIAAHHRLPKRRTARSDGRRVRPPREPTAPAEVDYADDAVIAREESIRDLGRELDALLAAPLLGPAKVTIAWEAGLRSMQEYRDAPFERIESLVGFGRPVAASLWTKLGRPVPSGPARHR
ncbi:MAG: class I tRNA ligase family protein, partial [Thermoplasmata archaeon]